MTGRAASFALALAVSVPILAFAQAGPAEDYIDTTNGLSLADAIKQAVEREPMLRAARTELDAARAMRTQAGLLPNPTVSLERRQEPAGTDNQTMVQLQWPLDLFRRSARIGVADREIEAVARSIDDRIRLLVADVRMRYGQAAASIRDLAIADNVAASARRELELLRSRVSEGATPPLERDLMEVEVRRFEAERLLAAGRTEAAMIELKRTIGLSADAQVKLRDTLESLAPAEDGSSVARSVAELRADVQEAEARVRVADARIERARSEGRFDITVFGSYMRMNAGFPQQGIGANGELERVHGIFHYVSGGAMVTMPWRNRNQGEIAAAQAERSGAVAELDAVKLRVEAEIGAAAAQDLQARRAVNVVEGGVQLARQNVEVVRQTYELGRARVFEVLAEQRRYLEMERAYTTALLTAYEARTALQRARGEL